MHTWNLHWETNVWSLHKSFASLYQEFMRKYDIVVSFPLLHERIYTQTKDTLLFSQLPFRCYVWFSPVSQSEKSDTLTQYDRASKQWETIPLTSYIGQHHERTFESFQEYDVHILIEDSIIYHERVMQYAYIFLAICTHSSLEKKTLSQKMQTIQQEIQWTSNVKRISQNLLNHIDTRITKKNIFRFFANMLGSHSPITLIQDRSFLYRKHTQKTQKEQCDYIIFSTNKTHTPTATRNTVSKAHNLDIVDSIAQKYIFAENTKKEHMKQSIDEYEQKKEYILYDVLMNELEKLWTKSSQNRWFMDMIQQIQRNKYISWGKRQHIWHYIAPLTCTDLFRDWKLAYLSNDPTLSTWDIAVFFHKDIQTRKYIQDYFQKLWDSDGWRIVYTSRTTEKSDIYGRHIEQNKPEQVYSDLLPKKWYVLQDNTATILIGSYQKLLQQKYDIILDLVTGKITMWWHKVTNKDLRSQSMTIDLLLARIKYWEHPIKNSQLPPSTYSKNKNEMSSKIIVPLKKCINLYLQKTPKISCNGKLHEFSVTVQTQDITIATIQPIYPKAH